MERQTHFLSMMTFPSDPTTCGTFRRPPTGLTEARPKIDYLPLDSNLNYFVRSLNLNSTNARASRRPQLVSPRRAPNRLPSSGVESQLPAFFQIPQILSASSHHVIHAPTLISYLGFWLWHFWLSHPPRAHMNTCAQCVHLTNPCTKRKVLSLTKPKGKIYKTKSLHNYITSWLGFGPFLTVRFVSICFRTGSGRVCWIVCENEYGWKFFNHPVDVLGDSVCEVVVLM